MSHILALDQGTTSSRSILFDRNGRARALAQREFHQSYPRAGWVEHDPEEIWTSQLETAVEALARAGVSAEDVVAVGITNQRETTLLWDRETGEPVGPAIVWQDRRTAGICDRLRERGLGAEVRRRTGLELDPYFSGTKLHWMLDRDAAIRERAESGSLAFGTVDSWLIWKLTGGRLHVTDPSNASRTLLYDILEKDWSPRLLELLGIPASLLPRVVDSSGVIGETAPELLGAPVPIAGIAGDQQAALFGQLCVRPGMIKNTYGTGCFLLMNTGEEPIASDNGLLTTVAWRRDGRTTYALEGAVFVAGAAVQWLRDGLGLIATAGEIEELASRVEDSGGVVCVPAFTGLGAPWWDAYARGTILGITRGTSAGHIARATLEGIAHQVADVVEAMRSDSDIEIEELRVDGGAAANDLLLQIQSDLLQTRIRRPRDLETTAAGAAGLAGLGVGFWSDLEELAATRGDGTAFAPRRSMDGVEASRARWRRAVRRAREWAEPEP